MNLIDYWNALDNRGRADYADRVGTSVQNIACHYIPKPRKIPRQRRLAMMAEASGGQVSLDEVVKHFYVGVDGKAA